MRTAAFRRVVNRLRSTPRRVWWTSFALVTLLSGLWALSQPVFAGPDEPAHVTRAVALDHGDLTGAERRGPLPRALRPVEESVRVVRAPAIYRSVIVPCFVSHRDLLARCLHFAEATKDTDVLTYEARQPPAYYGVIGAVSWVFRTGTGSVYLMRLLSASLTGALIATAVSALRWSRMSRLLGAGLLLAITPTVLFLGGVVNPGGLEIAASLALWMCGLALFSRAQERIDDRLVTAVGIAGCALALSRPFGPLWLVLIGVVLLGVTSCAWVRDLARSNRARLWAALMALSSLAQIAWDVIVRPRDATLTVATSSGLSAVEVVQESFGATFRWYREMIGSFGWMDVPAPTLTWVPWTVAIGFLVFVALAWVSRRHAAVLLGLLAGVVVVPILIASTEARAVDSAWVGSSTLPLAVGVPIIAAFMLASTERGRAVATTRFTVTVGFLVGVAQFLAFAQNLRRYTVGATKDLLYWQHAKWLPPASPLLLTIVYAMGVIAFTAWVLGAGQGRERPVGPTASL